MKLFIMTALALSSLSLFAQETIMGPSGCQYAPNRVVDVDLEALVDDIRATGNFSYSVYSIDTAYTNKTEVHATATCSSPCKIQVETTRNCADYFVEVNYLYNFDIYHQFPRHLVLPLFSVIAD